MKLAQVYKQFEEHKAQASGGLVMCLSIGMAIYNMPIPGWGWTLCGCALFVFCLVHNLAWSITGDLRLLMHYIDLHEKRTVTPLLDREDAE